MKRVAFNLDQRVSTGALLTSRTVAISGAARSRGIVLPSAYY